MAVLTDYLTDTMYNYLVDICYLEVQCELTNILIATCRGCSTNSLDIKAHICLDTAFEKALRDHFHTAFDNINSECVDGIMTEIPESLGCGATFRPIYL